MEESMGTNLSCLGNYLKTYLKKERPELYSELQQSGELNNFCICWDNNAMEVRNQIMNQGANWLEAEEAVLHILLSLVPKDPYHQQCASPGDFKDA